MSAEGVVVTNPKGNNVNVVISFVGRDGTKKILKTLRPGQGITVDKRGFTVAAVPRPARLLLTPEGCVPDVGRRGI